MFHANATSRANDTPRLHIQKVPAGVSTRPEVLDAHLELAAQFLDVDHYLYPTAARLSKGKGAPNSVSLVVGEP